MARIGSNATFSVGKGITYVGGGTWAGYSGIKVLNNNTVTLFEFTTGITPLNAIVEWYLEITGNVASSKNFNFVLTINGIDVINNGGRSGQTHTFYDVDPMHIIFPPNSLVKIESTTSNTSDVNTSSIITARDIE
jgi:hypothetical protein